MPRRREEHEKAKLLCAFLDAHKFVYCHVPNEGLRTWNNAAMLKAVGLKAGFPDYLIFDAPPDFCGAAIELKAKGKEPNDKQRKWLDALHARGWLTIWGDLDHVVAQLTLFYSLPE